MHHAFSLISFIFSTYDLYFLPGSDFAPIEEVNVPVNNSAEFLEDLGWLGWKRPTISTLPEDNRILLTHLKRIILSFVIIRQVHENLVF